jgi:hypothetical protein
MAKLKVVHKQEDACRALHVQDTCHVAAVVVLRLFRDACRLLLWGHLTFAARVLDGYPEYRVQR